MGVLCMLHAGGASAAEVKPNVLWIPAGVECDALIAQHPEVVAKLRATYDQWWSDVQPLLVNENVTGPSIDPFLELYCKQFDGSPTAADLKRMDPNKPAGGEGEEKPRKKRATAESKQLKKKN